MYRIVFSYCIVLLLLLETTYVYSKPYELNEFNNGIHNQTNQMQHENQMIFNVGKSTEISHQPELVEEEPVIFDISTQVAKFILYFIKKYCKNNDKIPYLQNLLRTKGIGSIFETNAEGKIQPNYAFFENTNSPQHIKIESIQRQPIVNVGEQQAIKYNHFETVPNYEIQAPIIPERQQQDQLHRIEVPTQNTHISKQYQIPQLPNNNYNYDYMETEPQNIQFKQQPSINTHEFNPMLVDTIERPQSIPAIPPAQVPDFHHQTHIKQLNPILTNQGHAGIYKQSKPIMKPEIYEPMYEYGITGDDYPTLSDYDYPMYTTTYDHIKVKPNEHHPVPMDSTVNEQQLVPKMQPEAYYIRPETNYETTTKHSIIDDWYKYVMPEHKVPQYQNNEQPQPQIQQEVQQRPEMRQFEPQQNYEPIKEKEKPAFIDKLIKYIGPEKEPNVPYADQEQPPVHTYDFTIPQEQQQQQEPKTQLTKESPGFVEKWLNKFIQPTDKPVIAEQPNDYDYTVQQQPKESPEKWYNKYLHPTEEPVFAEQPNSYEHIVPQQPQIQLTKESPAQTEKWYNKYLHPTEEPVIAEQPNGYEHMVPQQPQTQLTKESPGRIEKWLNKFIQPTDKPVIAEQPNGYDYTVQQQPKESPEKWYNKYQHPTEEPVIVEQPYSYEHIVPQQPKESPEKWYNKFLHPTEEPVIVEQPNGYEHKVPQQPQTQLTEENPGRIEKWLNKFIQPTDKPVIAEQPNGYDYTVQQQPKKSPEKWYNKYLHPTEEPVFAEQPNSYEHIVPQQPQTQLTKESPAQTEKWYTKYLHPTDKPVVAEQPNYYEYPVPQQPQTQLTNESPERKEKWYNKYLHPTEKPVIAEQPNGYGYGVPQEPETKLTKEPTIIDKLYKYIKEEPTAEPGQNKPGAWDKFIKYITPEDEPQVRDMNEGRPIIQDAQQFTWPEHQAPIIHDGQQPSGMSQEWYKYTKPTGQEEPNMQQVHGIPQEMKQLDGWFTVPGYKTINKQQQQQPQPHSWLDYEPKLEGPLETKDTGPLVIKQQKPISWIGPEPNVEMKPELIKEYSLPHYELNPSISGGQPHQVHYEYSIPQHKQPQIQYFGNEPNFKQPSGEYFGHEPNLQQPEVQYYQNEPNLKQPQVHFFGQQPDLKQQPQVPFFDQEPNIQQPGIQYFEQEQPNLKQPQIQEHHIEYKIPSMQLDAGNPSGLSSSGSPGGWFQYSIPHNTEKHIINEENQMYSYKLHQYVMPRTSNPEATNYWTTNEHQSIPSDALQKYADDVYNNYSAELNNLDNMKPYYKSTISGPKYKQFHDNIIQMKDVLHGWKTGGKFYDAPTMNNVMKMMSQLSNDTIHLMEPSGVQIEHTTSNIIIGTTEKSQEDEHSRRTFDGPEKLDQYLDNPENKKDFDTLDLPMQNLIAAYVKLRKEKDIPQNRLGLLLFLQKLKHQMNKYQKLFSHMEWVDTEMAKLSKNIDTNHDHSLASLAWDRYLIKTHYESFKNDMDYGTKSKKLLTLMNLPITAKSSQQLKTIIEKLLQDMVHLTESDPEFNHVKFFLGNQESMEKTPFYHRLKDFVISPKDWMDAKHSLARETSSGRRANSVEVQQEIETETHTTEMVTTEMEEITTQPTTPTKKIEKHNNVFREYLMTTDE